MAAAESDVSPSLAPNRLFALLHTRAFTAFTLLNYCMHTRSARAFRRPLNGNHWHVNAFYRNEMLLERGASICCRPRRLRRFHRTEVSKGRLCAAQIQIVLGTGQQVTDPQVSVAHPKLGTPAAGSSLISRLRCAHAPSIAADEPATGRVRRLRRAGYGAILTRFPG